MASSSLIIFRCLCAEMYKLVFVPLIILCLLLPSSASALDKLTIVTFGTSLTSRGHWQEGLRRVISECTGRDVAVINIAKSGMSSSWGLENAHRVKEASPDVILIEFASNDAALNRLMLPSKSRKNMESIILSLSSMRPKPSIYVMAMNPVHGSRGVIRPFISYYEHQHQAAAEGNGAKFINIKAEWSKLDKEELKAMIPDGVHPLREAAEKVIPPTIARQMISGCQSQ